jgi:hypothetical protein
MPTPTVTCSRVNTNPFVRCRWVYKKKRYSSVYIIDAVFDCEVVVVLQIGVVVVDVRLLHDVAPVRGARVLRNAVGAAGLLDIPAAPSVASLHVIPGPPHLRENMKDTASLSVSLSLSLCVP